MISFLIALLLILLALWLAGLWLGRGPDLKRYERPVEPAAVEVFGRPGGPSPEHQQAVRQVQEMANPGRRMSRKETIALMRQFMEDMPRGRDFNVEFVPVRVGGMAAEWVMAPGADADRRVLYIHGGAFIAGSPNSHRTMTARFAEVTGAAVLAIDYRLMPEHRRMDGIEDCREACRWILANGPNGPAAAKRVYISGDSAGGNLALGLAPWIRDQGLSAPDAVIAIAPLVDSTYSGSSARANVGTDVLLGSLFGQLLRVPNAILAWIFVVENRVQPANPLVSPIYADLAGLPPILVQVSEAEMLLDDAVRYVNKARDSGSPARLQRWPGLLHVWHIFCPEVPEAVEAFDRIAAFIESVESARSAGAVEPMEAD